MTGNNSPETPYEYTAEQPPSIVVVQALADLEGVDPTDLDYMLYDYIHPEALDTLSKSGAVEIRFTVDQYEETLSGSSTVQITLRCG